MKTKPLLVLFVVSFGLMIVGAILGNILESSGTITRENLGSSGMKIVLAGYFFLFCLVASTAVPLLLRLFITGQIRIGNGQLFPIKWLQAHERIVVYGVWGLFAVGLILAFTLAGNEILALIE